MSVDSEMVTAIVDEVLATRDRQPPLRATYRLQLTGRQFRIADAQQITGYLRDLGVSHLYASPCFRSRRGSTHGYDVVNPQRLNDELGSAQEFQEFFDSLREHGLGQILDIVPNHMSVATDENAWWMDVLMHGPASAYAAWFDVDWKPVKPELEGKILLPVLDDVYGNVLEAGRLPLRHREGGFFVECNGSMLPLDPQTWPDILTPRMDELRQSLGEESPEMLEFLSIVSALDRLPPRNDSRRAHVEERRRERLVIQGRMQRLFLADRRTLAHVEANLETLNGTATQPSSFDALDALLEKQAFRLVSWKSGSDELNYRRFFDVTELAAVCMENLEVFEATHRRLFELAAANQVHGFRVDHIDGLFDPAQYLWRLQWGYLREIGRQALTRWNERCGTTVEWHVVEDFVFAALHARLGGPEPKSLFLRDESTEDVPTSDTAAATSTRTSPQVPTTDAEHGRRPGFFVLVEKILGVDEPLPSDWPIEGTTGYDSLNLLSGLLVDRKGLRELKRHYERFVGRQDPFEEVVYQCKRLILSGPMQSEVQLLAHRLDRLSNRHRKCRDFTLQSLRAALREIMACFPVYRTYIRDAVSDRDRRVVQRAVALARRRNPATNVTLLHFVKDVLLLQQPPDLDLAGQRQREVFIGRFQQVTSPVMAKGVEDTAFYRYLPLTSLCEVGGEPAHRPTNVEEFHHQNALRLQQWPHSMLATTTHDTKRAEDVRARIHVLAEIPSLWRKEVARWTRWNKHHLREVDGQPAPSRDDEWLFYQTVVGVWPLTPPSDEEVKVLIGRLQQYMEKATHEAKLHTSWISPNPAYDEAVREFVARCLEDPGSKFRRALQEFHERVVDAGLHTAASQTLLKLLSPGLPDIYQGQELWDFSLVDPDNRRPVDFERRKRLLAEVVEATTTDAGRQEFCRTLARHPRDDRLKLFITRTALAVRQAWEGRLQPDRADYLPLEVGGARADHLCAFAWKGRLGGAQEMAIIAAPRLLMGLAEDAGAPSPCVPERWGDTVLKFEAGSSISWRNEFTGQTVKMSEGRLPAGELFRDFPVALLTGKQQSLE